MYKVKSPVLFLVFNRPVESEKLFNAIRMAQPTKLYVAADGPRNNEKDNELCQQVRNIVSKVDWDCEVNTLFRDENLGTKKAVSDAITWFFNNVEEGIILEDDCLPSEDFFRFCDSSLDKYRNNSAIGHICGSNLHDDIPRGDGDYYYSKLPYIWGWASWSRVWSKYDITMSDFENFKKNDSLKKVTDDKNVKKHFYHLFSLAKKGIIEKCWDYQYFYSFVNNDFVSIVPNYNMISNIGFNENATNTFEANSLSANRKYKSLPSEIKSPTGFKVERMADTYVLLQDVPSQVSQVVQFMKNCVKKVLRYLHLYKN